jgi:uncharacterized protein (TIGR03437 family)
MPYPHRLLSVCASLVLSLTRQRVLQIASLTLMLAVFAAGAFAIRGRKMPASVAKLAEALKPAPATFQPQQEILPLYYGSAGNIRQSHAAEDLAADAVTVSAASYEPSSIAPDSIVSSFGVKLAIGTAAATDINPAVPGIQLPTTLGGTTVRINGELAQLLYVSPSQINFIIPSNVQSGLATLQITAGDGEVSNGTVLINRVSPGIFTANADGQGAPAAYLVRIKADNSQHFESATQLNTATGRLEPRAIDLGPEGERVFLVLFVSGTLHATDSNNDANFAESFTVVAGGQSINPIYSGPQGQFIGLDQINVELPRTLIGRGRLSLVVGANGFNSSNITEIEIAGTQGNAPPQVSGFDNSTVLAGQMLQINGNGFSTNATDNLVRINGTEARVMSAIGNQLSVLIPFGAAGGNVTVRTQTGEGTSNSALTLRTSISGFVEDTQRQPMSNVAVKVIGTNTIVRTNAEGLFVLPDVGTGTRLVEIDSSQITSPAFPKVTLKTAVSSNRDNQFARPIAMQQATGATLAVGAGSLAPGETDPTTAKVNPFDEKINGSVQSGGVTLEVPDGASATFPDGARGGTISLTVLDQSRTPVELPDGFFSSTIAQITPFGVSLNPGGKLTFPNSENHPAGSQVTLFRFDQNVNSATVGQFIEAGGAMVSLDGQHIETTAGAVTTTGIYFVARLRPITTVVGKVVDADGRTPVRRALVRFRGQESFTDGNGGFVLRYVPVTAGELISVEASYVRDSDRIERKQSASVSANLGGITTITPDIVLPETSVNRPPVIEGPFTISVPSDRITEIPVSLHDPDQGQTINSEVTGAPFVSLLPGGSATEFRLRFNPTSAHTGNHTITLTVRDNPGLQTTRNIQVTVVQSNRPPVADGQSVSTNEDTAKAITLTGSDPDGNTLTYSIVAQPQHGSLSGTLPNVTFTPTANYNGTDSFTFKVNDGTVDSNIATVSLTISSVNDVPVADAQTVTTDEDTAKTITLTASDVDGNPLTYTIVASPTKGVLSGTAPNLTYTPNANLNGADSFTFKVNDGTADSAIVTVSININAINDAPVANGQSVNTDEDTAKTFTLTGSDVEGSPLTYTIVANPTKGVLSGTAPNLTYTPNANLNGADSFTFKVNDGTVDSATATVNIAIAPINDVPTANGQSVSTNEDTARAITLTGSDPDGSSITYSIFAAPTNGTLTGTAPNLTYTPNANFNGSDSFTFIVNDGIFDSATATVSITVTPVNDAPTANGTSETTNEDTPKAITLTGNDIEGSTLTYTVVTPPANGSLSGTAPNLTYTPNANYNGTDSFTFKVNDGQLDSANTTVSLTITAVNDAPVANGNSGTTPEDIPVTVTLTGTDVEGSPLTYTVVTPPANGTLSGTAPNLTYTPALNFNGADSFTFKVNDGQLDSATATVSLIITPVNDAPTADAQSVSVTEDIAKAFTLTGTDIESSTLTYTVVTSPTNGTLSGTAPNLTYTPNANYFGTDSFTFKVNDGALDSATATVTLTINPQQDAPVANGQSVSTDEDTPKAITLTGTDVDGDTLTYSLISGPTNGTLSGTVPNLTYTPNANYNGADSFTFKVNDGFADSNTATVSISVTNTNDPPVANSQSVSTNEDTPKAITLTATDADGNTLTYAVLTTPANGTLSGTAPNLTYTPNANYFGSDSFTFKVNDGTVDSNTATVSITVVAVNDAPVANGQSVNTDEDIAKTITLTGSDVEGSPLTYTIVASPTKGVLSGTAPNLTYTPNANLNGADSFTFKVNDGTVDSATATVNIAIAPINDVPTANGQSVSTNEDTAKAITLTGSDVEGSTLAYTVVTAPANGTLTGTAPNLTYTPNANFNGADSFTFIVNDGTFDSATATVSITITAVNDAPVANGASDTTSEDTPKAITLTGSDIEGSTLAYTVVTAPANGTLSGTAPNLTYTPNANYNGADSFTFKVNDGQLDSATATVSITVTPVNDVPTANGTSETTNEDTAKAITLTGSDVEGSTLAYTVVTAPANGTLSGTAPNLTYTPNANYNGADSFTFKVNDGTVDSAVATVSITVTPVNDAPTANGTSETTNEDTPKAITLTGSDIEGSTLAYTVVTAPANGTLSGTAPNLTYTPNANYNGADSFTFKVNDGQLDSATATVSITVNAINDPPVLTVPGNQTVSTEDLVNFTITASDVDAGQTITLSATSVPSGANFNPSTGEFSWTPQFFQVGVFRISFRAQDNGTPQGEDNRSVQITVNPVLNWAQTSGTNGDSIFALHIDSDNEARIGTFEGMFTSNDYGQVWSRQNGNLPPGGLINNIVRHGSFLFITRPGPGGTVFRSPDNGNTWTSHNSGLTNTDFTSLLADTSGLYLGTANGIFKSTDNGNTWAAINNGLTTNTVNALAIGRVTTTTYLYAGLSQGAVVSTDFGATWTAANDGLPVDFRNGLYFPVTALHTRGQKIFAGANNQVYEKNLNVTSWNQFSNGLYAFGPVSSLTSDGSYLFAGFDLAEGVWRVNLSEEGSFWQEVVGNLKDQSIKLLVARNGHVLAGTASGVYGSDDNGDNWTVRNSGIPLGRATGFARTDTDVFTSNALTGVSRTSNNGIDWTQLISDPLPLETTAIIASGSELLVGAELGGVFRSGDNGNSWQSDSFPVEGKITALAADGTNVFATTPTTINKTPVGQSHWTTLSGTGLPGSVLQALAVTGSSLFVGTDGDGVYVSNDGGNSFAPSGLAGKRITTLLANGINIMAGTQGDGVYLSNNSGASWVQSNTGITNLDVTSLSAGGGKLYVGTRNGVFVSDNGGTSWKNGSFNLGNPNIRSLFLKGTVVFAGTDGSGVFKTVGTNRPATGNNLSASTDEEVPVSITLTGSDPDGDTLTFAVHRQPSYGTLSGTAPNLTYTPNLNFFGTDTFTYKLSDGTVYGPLATVTITVNGLPDPPEANNQDLYVEEDVPFSFALAGFDPDGDPLTYTIITSPANGTLSGTGANRTYTPNANYFGPDSLTYKVNDGTTDSNTATVSFNVTEVNDAPVIQDPPDRNVDEGNNVTITVTGTDIDPGQTLTFSANNLPSGANFDPGTRTFTWTPGPGQAGTYTVTFSVQDDGIPSLSDSTTVNIIVSATTLSFTPTGPAGGSIYTLLDGGSLLLAGADDGIYTSSDNAQNWVKANGNLNDASVKAIRGIGSTLYVGRADGAWRSFDNGATWSQINTGLSNTNIRALLVKGSLLFAATGGGVYSITENGSGWSNVSTGLVSLDVFSLNTSGIYLYAGTAFGVSISNDDGSSWSTANTGFPSTPQVNALTFDGTKVYSGTSIGVYSADIGATANWSAVNAGLTSTNVLSLLAGGTNLYAGTAAGGVFKNTLPAPGTWSQVNAGVRHRTIQALASSGTTLHAGTPGGVFTTTNAGTNWQYTTKGILLAEVNRLVKIGTRLYAGTKHEGLFYSTNNGQNWVPMGTAGLPSYDIRSVVMDGTDIYVGLAPSGVYKSTNDGATWTQFGGNMSGQPVEGLLISGTKILATQSFDGVYQSDLTTASWTQVLLSVLAKDLAKDSSGGIYTTAGSSGVYKSTSNGNAGTWSLANTGLSTSNTYALTFDSSSGKLYAGTATGVFVSSNNAANWTAINTGANAIVNSIAVDGSRLFAASPGNGVYFSRDNGATWALQTTGLPPALSLKTIYAGNQKVLAGTANRSTYVSTY